MTAITTGALLAGMGLMGLWFGSRPSAAVPPALATRLRVTYWLLVLAGAGLIAHAYLPTRTPADRATRQMLLGSMVTAIGVVGLRIHMLRAREPTDAAEETMWALRSKAGFILCIPIGLWMAVEGLMRRLEPLAR